MIKISKIIIYYSIRSGFQFGAKTSDNKKPPKKPGDEKKHEMGKIKVKLDNSVARHFLELSCLYKYLWSEQSKYGSTTF